MKTIIALACLVGLAAANEPKIPHPDPSAIAKAQQLVREIYGANIKQAKKPADKAQLATDFMEAAAKTTDDEASRFVLLIMARDFAVEAKVRKTAIDAAIAIADRYQLATGDPNNAQAQFEKAQQLWEQAEEAGKTTRGSLDREKERLRLQVQAIEWYAQAMAGTTGSTKQLCEKRIAEAVEEAASSNKQSDNKPDKSQKKEQTPKLTPSQIRKQRAQEQRQAREALDKKSIFNKPVEIINSETKRHLSFWFGQSLLKIVSFGSYCVIQGDNGRGPYLAFSSSMRNPSSRRNEKRNLIRSVSHVGEASPLVLVHNANGSWTIFDRASGLCLEAYREDSEYSRLGRGGPIWYRLRPREADNKGQEWLIKPVEIPQE